MDANEIVYGKREKLSADEHGYSGYFDKNLTRRKNEEKSDPRMDTDEADLDLG
jgi:hypothetical protein